jgi:membrane-bound lytic murein transglycosylase B
MYISLIYPTNLQDDFSAPHSTGGTAAAQWLRYCATNQKVAGSIPDGVMEFFIDINSSDRTMALGSTQPLTEMSTGNISWW